MVAPLPFLVALGAVAGGTALTYWDRGRCPVRVRVAAGACLGFALLGLFTIPLSSRGVTAMAAAVATAATMLPLAIVLDARARARMREDLAAMRAGAAAWRDRGAWPAGLLLVLTAALLLAGFHGAALETADGIQTHSVANRHDLSLHLAIVAQLLWGGVLPPTHPEFAGVTLTYPFVVDVGAAVLVLAGARLADAFLLQNVILAIALIVLLHYWAYLLTGNRVAAALTPALVLFGSGLGWLLMLRDAAGADAGFLRFLMDLPYSYTRNTANLQWGNLATIMLIPQRSLDLGLPLVLIVTVLWWRAVRDRESAEVHDGTRLMILAGVVAGLLPLTHTHSFGVVLLAAGGLMLLFPPWRRWMAFFAVTAAVAAPQMIWIARGSSVGAESFFEWMPGWSKGPEPVLWFWFKNTGLFIPLLIAALLAPRRWIPQDVRRFFVPFLLFFILPNLFRLAPRVWDNNKVLIYWYLAAAPLVALLLARAWNTGALARAGVAVVFASLVGAGLLDAWRVAAKTVTLTMFDPPALEFASLVRASTQPETVMVRAPALSHPILLTGRASVLGYVSRVRLHGLDPSRREADVACIYTGCPDAARALESYRADYVVLGPLEREAYQVNDQFLSRFPVVAEAGGHQLRRVEPAAVRAGTNPIQ